MSIREEKRDHSQYYEDMNTLAQQNKPFAKKVMSSLEDAAKDDDKCRGYLNQARRVPFSKGEDAKLIQLIEASKNKMLEERYWSNVIAPRMPGRTARQCRERDGINFLVQM